MKISIFGTGYVGLVTGTCFAEMGNQVICVDVDTAKIEKLKQGISPIYEPGLDQLILSNVKENRLEFTTDAKTAIEQAEIIFIAVGTPPDEDGSADLQYVLQVAKTIGQSMDSYRVVVNKSTVPVGTAQKVEKELQSALQARNVKIEFDVVSNPEFLKEGTAIEDCLKPSRVVIGCASKKAEQILRRLYEPFLRGGNPFLVMDVASSELTKYAANAMLATKISFMNEISRICEKTGADVERVRQGIGSDPRIGYSFIYPGIGYGGSCFPKDVRALIQTAGMIDENVRILKAVEETNEYQREQFYQKILKHFHGNVSGKKLAFWGLSFKPGTDDIRDAPAIYLIEQLLKAGAMVHAYDPVAMHETEKRFQGHKNLTFSKTQYEAISEAEALCVITEWKPFREPDFQKIKTLLKTPVIFDARNLYDPSILVQELGFQHYPIGRAQNFKKE